MNEIGVTFQIVNSIFVEHKFPFTKVISDSAQCHGEFSKTDKIKHRNLCDNIHFGHIEGLTSFKSIKNKFSTVNRTLDFLRGKKKIKQMKKKTFFIIFRVIWLRW